MKSHLPRVYLSLALLVVVSTMLVQTACSGKRGVAGKLTEAGRYYAAGEYDKAEIEYKNVLQSEALNASAIAQLGLIYADEGRVRLAIPYLLKARELTPDNLDVRQKLGTLYAMFGRVKEAREEALYILDRKPADDVAPLLLIEASTGSPELLQAARQKLQQLPGGAADGAPVLVASALLEIRAKNLPAADAALKRALTANPKYVSTYSAQAGLYRLQRDASKMDQALKTAAELAPLRSGKQLQYAQFKLQSGDKPAARQILDDLSKKAPDYLPALAMLAELAATEKKYDESMALTSRILSRDPEYPDAMLLSGRLKLAKGEPDKAVLDLERMLKTYPGSPQALYFAGLAYAAAGDQTKALDRLTKAVNANPAPDAVMALASLNMRKGDYSAVILGLKPLVQQHPENQPVRMLLADAYRAQGNDADALALNRQMEKDFPTDPRAPLMSGLALLQQRKFDDARAAFEEAIKRSPGYLPALEQLVYLDLANKRFEPATQRINAELARTPNSAALHVLLAKAFMVQKENAQAQSEFEKAIELQPDLSEAYYQLARLHISTGQQQKALASLEASVAKSPQDVRSLFLIGLIQDDQKNYPAAREAYEKVLAQNPKFSPVLNNLAYLYSERFNELDKALDAAQKAQELLPTEPHVADTLGWILYKKGQYARAAALLEDAADKLSDQAEVRYHLGVVQYALGQEDAANASLLRAVEHGATAPWIQDARKKLAVLAIDPRKADAAAIGNLEKLAAEQPADTAVLARLATVHETRGDIDQAIAVYQTAAKANPSSPAPVVSLARLYLAKKDSTKALAAAKTARKLAGDNVAVGRTVGWIAYQAGDYAWAANLLQEAARRLENEPDVLYQSALATYSIGKVSDAENQMREALSPGAAAKPIGLLPGLTPTPLISPAAATSSFAEAANARAFLELVALASKPDAGAQTTINAGLKNDVTRVPALMAQGALQEQKADAAGARQSYERVLSQFSEFAPAKLRLAVLAAAAPEVDAKGLEWAQQARAAYPTDPEAAKALGILTYRKGDDLARSVTLLKQAVAAKPADAEATYYLGMAQAKNKDAAAKATLKKAIELGLRTDLAAEAKKAVGEQK